MMQSLKHGNYLCDLVSFHLMHANMLHLPSMHTAEPKKSSLMKKVNLPMDEPRQSKRLSISGGKSNSLVIMPRPER